jgi:hypothetical protein
MSAPTILHISVDPALAKLRGRLLSNLGYQVHLCSSVDEIERTTRFRNVDACIVDQSLTPACRDLLLRVLNLGVPVLRLSLETPSEPATGLTQFCSPSAREFLPKLKAMFPNH